MKKKTTFAAFFTKSLWRRIVFYDMIAISQISGIKSDRYDKSPSDVQYFSKYFRKFNKSR